MGKTMAMNEISAEADLSDVISKRDKAIDAIQEAIAASSEKLQATASPPQALFHSDRAPSREAPLAPSLEPLAQLIVHPAAEGPFTIGIFGGSGSGKTVALEALLARVRALGGQGRLRALDVRIAAGESDNPTAAIAAGLYDSLVQTGPQGATYVALAQESAQAGRDPLAVVHETTEQLGETRRKLDVDRRSLDEFDGRRTRLAETVLYETGGSRVESYARANRARIDARLKAFGFDTGDPVATYKDLVRDVYESGGLFGRVGAFFHALWAFRGQTKLIVWAIVMFLIAWGLERLFGARAGWIGWLHSAGGDKIDPTVNFLDANAGAIHLASALAFWIGVALLVFNVLRAVRFLLPVTRGVSLLKTDIETRRAELDRLIAHQTRRVDALSAEAEAQTRRIDEATRRAGAAAAASPAASPVLDKPFRDAAADREAALARDFLNSIGRACVAGKDGQVPQRIVVAIDDLDALAPERAAAWIDAAHAALASPAFVSIVVCDPDRLWPKDFTRRDKLVQIPWNAGAAAAAAGQKAETSVLDAPLGAAEAQSIDELNRRLATTPRAAKRLSNLYRVARTQTDARTALAALLAVEINGGEGELARVASPLAGADPNAEARFDEAPRLEEAFAAAGGTPTFGEIAAAMKVARIYATRAF
jgi:hypothetical protein